MGWPAIALVLAGVLYNALLAFAAARGLPVSRPLVAGTELLVLTGVCLCLLRSGIRPADSPALLLLLFFVADALIVSLLSGEPFVDMGRNAAVIALFLMLGTRVSEGTVRRTFVIAAWLIFLFLLLEVVAVRSYAALLEPGRYFELTRGISRFELDEIGLFANALGFDDRFSIANIVGHRTSSLFLEQVSLANLAAVLTVFLVGLWPRLSWTVRIAFPLLVIAILLTNNSRTGLALALAAPLVYLVAPKLPRSIVLILMPIILVAAYVVDVAAPPSRADDLVGRLSLTISTLRELDMAALVGARAPEATAFLDSGYTFVIYGSSIVGVVALWLFFSLVGAGPGAAEKRASLMTGLYLFLNLTVSGTSIFSIKTGALLWLLIGYLSRERQKAAAEPV